MPRVRITVQVNGNPLRRAYVEHIVLGGGAGMYMTDNSGRVRDNNGDLGIDSLTNHVDIRVLCQNSVVKVLDGATVPFPFAVNQDKSGLTTGAVVNLNTNSEQDDHYAILNRCLLAYDVVFRQFAPFSDASNPDFPLGRKTGLRATKDQGKRIEVSHPSNFPGATLAFVEANSAATGYPLIHIRRRNQDGRLFGESGQRPTLIPSELGHALHFSLFSGARRVSLEADYLAWIALDVVNGSDGTHSMGKQTSPMVAYLEAFDHFASRFAEYVRRIEQGGTSTLLRPQTMSATIRNAFLRREREGNSVEGQNVSTVTGGQITPAANLGGANDEGSVYGCIFVDFARRAGMLTAVNAYLRSAADGVRTFGMYKDWIAANRPQHLASLEAAQATWNV